MAAAWEECPPLYTLLDVAGLMTAGVDPSEVGLQPMETLKNPEKVSQAHIEGMHDKRIKRVEHLTCGVIILTGSNGPCCIHQGKAGGGIMEVDMEDDSDNGPAEAAQDEAHDGVALLKTSR